MAAKPVRPDYGAVLSDLEAENEEFDCFIQGLTEVQWDAPTPAIGWQIRHQIAHLSFADEVGLDCIVGSADRLRALMFEAGRDRSDPLAELSTQAPRDLLLRWRQTRTQLRVALEEVGPDRRVPWAAGPMAARSFATARLMECWAHGLDCHAAIGSVPTDTDRLRHVCHIGYRALPYAFGKAGLHMPAPLHELRLDLKAPDGSSWRIGEPDAGQLITGSAGEWARVAVQRMSASDASSLRSEGELAAMALLVARAFA